MARRSHPPQTTLKPRLQTPFAPLPPLTKSLLPSNPIRNTCTPHSLGPAICFGEWGGWGSEGPDRVWQTRLAEWMAANDVTDSFYWCARDE